MADLVTPFYLARSAYDAPADLSEMITPLASGERVAGLPNFFPAARARNRPAAVLYFKRSCCMALTALITV